MQLLTPAIRERIRQIVLDAIKRLPPHITPSDPRFLEWLESLIRYHAAHQMDPAAEKAPVLGGIGIAEKAFPSYSEEFDPYQMWTGFIELLEVEGVGTEGASYQNAETLTLYGNYSDPHLVLLGPKTPVVGGAVPPSFSDGSKHGLLETQRPGSYTGKLAWLIAGQYGLAIENPYWISRDTFTRTTPANGRLSGEGIYTDADGRYWFLDIDATGYAGTATLLTTPLQYVVDEAREDGLDASKMAMIETHALAIAKRTDTVQTINFSGDEPEGEPLAYGWHFSMTGHAAAMVSHVELEDAEENIDATKYTVAISKGESSFTADITADTTQTWRPSIYAVFWKPFEDDDGRNHCPLDRYNGSSGDGSDIVFYCYYDSDDVLQDCKYSTEYGELVQEHTNCDPTVINGLTLTTHVYRTWGDRTKDTVGVDEEIIVSQTGTATGKWHAKYDQKETIIDTPVYLACCLGQSISPSGYRGPCTADGFITYPTVDIKASDLCPGDGTQCRIKRTWTAYYSDESWEYWDYTGGASIFSSVAIIFPFDCADGVAIIRGETNGGWGLKYASNPWPSPGREKWRKYTYEIEDCPGFSCGSSGTQETDKYMIYASEPSGGPVGFEYHFEVETERHFFHAHGHFERVTGDDDASGIDSTDLWDGWLSKSAYPETCGGPGSTQWQGQTEAVKSWVGVQFEIDNDFPEDASLPAGFA